MFGMQVPKTLGFWLCIFKNPGKMAIFEVLFQEASGKMAIFAQHVKIAEQSYAKQNWPFKVPPPLPAQKMASAHKESILFSFGFGRPEFFHFGMLS